MSFFDSFFHAYLPCALPKDYQSEFCMEIRRQNDFLSDEILQKYINVHCAVTWSYCAEYVCGTDWQEEDLLDML